MIAESNESGRPRHEGFSEALHPGEPPLVSGLEAGLVPLREFPLRKWYYATPLWYYHRPAQEHHLNVDPKFYELVDPGLRDLCALALQHGLATTPSCQGHFYGRDRFEAIWQELQEAAALVPREGLRVKDSETDEEFLFRDEGFVLSWPDFEEFHAQAAAHQSRGYIGLALSPQAESLALRLREDAYRTACACIAFDEELSRVLGQPIFGIEVNPRTTEERDYEWAAITRYLHALLSVEPGGHAPGTSSP